MKDVLTLPFVMSEMVMLDLKKKKKTSATSTAEKLLQHKPRNFIFHGSTKFKNG
jgi:phage pi2 protein 07